jgi:hypothetical protein
MRTWFNRRFVAYIFWAFVIALAVNAFRIHQPTLRAALLPAKAVPYTVVLQEFWLHRDGTAVPSVKYTNAIRGDGSRAMELTSNIPASPGTQRILDFSSGKEMRIFYPQQLKSTMFDPAKLRAAYWLRVSGNNCLIPGYLSEKPDGEEVINGYRTIKLINGFETQWFALDYGCALIKGRAEWPDGQVSEKRLVALVPGEPAPSIFDDPAGVQEAPPSRWLPPDADAGARSRFDAYYESHRPPDAAPQPNEGPKS